MSSTDKTRSNEYEFWFSRITLINAFLSCLIIEKKWLEKVLLDIGLRSENEGGKCQNANVWHIQMAHNSSSLSPAPIVEIYNLLWTHIASVLFCAEI